MVWIKYVVIHIHKYFVILSNGRNDLQNFSSIICQMVENCKFIPERWYFVCHVTCKEVKFWKTFRIWNRNILYGIFRYNFLCCNAAIPTCDIHVSGLLENLNTILLYVLPHAKVK